MTRHRKTHGVPRWVYRLAEFVPIEQRSDVPPKTRGVYALLRRRRRRIGERYDVLYIGISVRGVRRRLESHARSRGKTGWTHFSVLEVWPNVSEDELRQLEGLLRHIYRKDSRPTFQKQRRMWDLTKVAETDRLAEWQQLPLAGRLGRSKKRKSPKRRSRHRGR